MLSSTGADWTIEEAQRKAREHLSKRETMRLLRSPPQANSDRSLSRFSRHLSTGSIPCEREAPRTIEEIKRQLEDERYNELLQNSFRRRAPLGRGNSSRPDNNTDVWADSCCFDNGIEKAEGNTVEVAEESLQREIATRMLAEELEVREMHDRIERQVHEEHQRRISLYLDMHSTLNTLMARHREEINRDSARRRQESHSKAKKDRDMVLQLHKTLAEKIVNSQSAVKKRSEEIFRMAEKAKREEARLEQQKQLEERAAAARAQIEEIVAKIERCVANIQQDTSVSQKAKAKLLALKKALQEAKDDLHLAADNAMKQVQTILDDYDQELKNQAAQEIQQKAAESQQKAEKETKENVDENLYIKATQRLKEAGEQRKQFVESEAQQRKDILRIVQLTVNKIQVNTNNLEHALLFIKLFSREEVRVGITGFQSVKLSSHKEALNYAMHLTAERILGNVEKLPFSSMKEWLPYAIVVSMIWSASAKFGEIFFDHLVSRCPFLVPVYFSNLEPDEASAFVEKFVHNKNEDHPRFVTRMGVYARLLGVIMCQKPRWGTPFPPDRMWRLLTATAKVELRSVELADIAAMVVQSLLEASGHVLNLTYKRQFGKLMHVLCTEFFAKLQAQPKKLPNVFNLEEFLKEVAAVGGDIPPLPSL